MSVWQSFTARMPAQAAMRAWVWHLASSAAPPKAPNASRSRPAGDDAENQKVKSLLGYNAMGPGTNGGKQPGRLLAVRHLARKPLPELCRHRDRANADGHFGVDYLGADYVVNRNLLIGALVQWDIMEQRSNSEVFAIKGQGWIAGPAPRCVCHRTCSCRLGRPGALVK